MEKILAQKKDARKVLLGTLEVYGLEGEDGTEMTVLEELNGLTLWTSGYKAVLVQQGASQKELKGFLDKLDESE